MSFSRSAMSSLALASLLVSSSRSFAMALCSASACPTASSAARMLIAAADHRRPRSPSERSRAARRRTRAVAPPAWGYRRLSPARRVRMCRGAYRVPPSRWTTRMRPGRASPGHGRALPVRSVRAGATRRISPPSHRARRLLPVSARISSFHARACSSLSGVESSSCCCNVKALSRSALACARTVANSAVASSPNWARANPSSCSLVLSASSVCTRADAA